MNALKYHWCETSLLFHVVLKHVTSKDFTFKKSVQGPVLILYPAYGIVPYQTFFMSCYIIATFRKKTSTCGSHVGHIRIVLWVSGSVGQMSQQVLPTFNPDVLRTTVVAAAANCSYCIQQLSIANSYSGV